MRIFHLALPQDWERALNEGSYQGSTRGRTVAQEGFVHCSEAHQVELTRWRFYDDLTDVVLLEIDTELLTSPWLIEQLPGADQAFPHVYGPLDLEAVVSVRRI